MPAPLTIKNRIETLLDALWDAQQAGTLQDREWAHDATMVLVAGRRIEISATVGGESQNRRLSIMLKRIG